MKRRNSISGQFTARRIEMLESRAYCVLSRHRDQPSSPTLKTTQGSSNE
jgi:hypothetical protein